MAVAAHGEVLLARWLPPGTAGSVRVGPLPHLREVAAAAARRPGYVVVLADRDGAAVIAHTAGDLHPARHYETGARPGMQPDPHPGRPPAQHHGERHLTGREPLGGGEQNAAFTAGRVAEAAAAVSAHVILGAGDQHILDAVSKHLPGSLGPVTAIASGPVSADSDEHLGARIATALDEITGEATDAVGAPRRLGRRGSGTRRGPRDRARRRAAGRTAGRRFARRVRHRRGHRRLTLLARSRPTEFGAGDPGTGIPVPLEDGLVWAALHQDAIIVQLAERSGPLAGQPTAALLRRGAAS